LLFPILAAILLEISGKAAHQFEETRFFDYANFGYIFIVLLGFVAVAVGGLSLIWLSKLAEKEVNQK